MQYRKIITKNKRASFDYFIEETFEVGIVLLGGELKSLRSGKSNIEDSHGGVSGNEIFLYNSYIAEYEKDSKFSKYFSRRPRKLLLHKREIRKIIGKIKQKGYSLIPVVMYFNEKNKVKLEVALAKGKKLHDKRNSIKENEWKKEQGRFIRDKR